MQFKKIFFLINVGCVVACNLQADALGSLAQGLQSLAADGKIAELKEELSQKKRPVEVEVINEIIPETSNILKNDPKLEEEFNLKSEANRLNLEIISQLNKPIEELQENPQIIKTPESKNIDSTQAVKIYDDIKKIVDDQFIAGTYQENYDTSKIFTADVLLGTADAFVVKMQERLKKAEWLKGGTPDYLFVRKLILPADSEIEFRGDLHGDVRSLIRWLDDLQSKGWLDKNNIFKLVKKNQYLAFLGDYTDRGKYGAEVMYIIMQLFLHNPDNVLIVRGNHEDFNIVQSYGFVASGYQQGELFKKFGEEFKFSGDNDGNIKKIMDVYEQLPVALFLGCENKDKDKTVVDFVQCCHGGMEPLYNSKPLLEDIRKDLYERFDEKIQKERDTVPCALHVDVSNLLAQCNCNKQKTGDCVNNGFQWNDFDFFNEKPDGTWSYYEGRGRILHKKLTTEILKHAGGKNKVWSVFRAHQHNTQTIQHILQYGNGLYKLWSEKTAKQDWWIFNKQWSSKSDEPVSIGKYSVWTFNVAPRTGAYEKGIADSFNYDTVARLTLKPGFDNWILQPRQIKVV